MGRRFLVFCSCVIFVVVVLFLSFCLGLGTTVRASPLPRTGSCSIGGTHYAPRSLSCPSPFTDLWSSSVGGLVGVTLCGSGTDLVLG